jgi:hypothetical protein
MLYWIVVWIGEDGRVECNVGSCELVGWIVTSVVDRVSPRGVVDVCGLRWITLSCYYSIL